MSVSSDSEVSFRPNAQINAEEHSQEHDLINENQSNNVLDNEEDEFYNAQGDHTHMDTAEDSEHESQSRRIPILEPYIAPADQMHVPIINYKRPLGITIKPDTFNGDDDWDQYISHFENCADLGDWTERERALTLAACLKGQARVFYSSLLAHEKCDYRTLVSKLEQRFGSTRQQTRWLSRLQSRQRLPHEPIASFGDDLRLLSQKAYPSLDSNAQEMLALQQFYKAVSLEMRCRLMDRDTKSITEAVEVVERYEEVLGSDSAKERRRFIRSVGQRDQNQSTEGAAPKSDSLDQTLKNISERLEMLEKRREIQPDTYGRRQRTCFICNSPRHLYRQCPQNKNDRKFNGVTNGQRNKPSGNEKPSFL